MRIRLPGAPGSDKGTQDRQDDIADTIAHRIAVSQTTTGRPSAAGHRMRHRVGAGSPMATDVGVPSVVGIAQEVRLMNANPRTAIVTGAARGIGAATAKRLSRDGFAVGVLDLDADAGKAVVDQIEAAGGTAIAFGADVADETAVETAVAAVAAELGPPTVLVNNAGLTRDNLLFKLSASDWDAVMSVNLRGSFLMSRAAQKHMTEARWGRIVNLSSVSALGNRGQANYSAAKAGLQGFTRTLAIELGKFGVTVNAVAPGFIETDMTAAVAARSGMSFEDLKATAAKDIPAGRVGQPDDIAAVVSFLVSDEASFVSGQVVYVAGGPRS